MQTKLNQFFSIKVDHKKHKKCFIYDPQNFKATFVNEPLATDEFVVKKLGISLYFRGSKTEYELPIIETHVPTPVLKSNLQKAIRYGKNLVAITTALAMLQTVPNDLYRRPAIICIEDVSVMDSYPILIWLMMADYHYNIDSNTKYLTLQIVNSLCNGKHTNTNDHKSPGILSHELLQDCKCHDVLLGLYYRQKYGGMKGDIEMLSKAITYYYINPDNIVKTCFEDLDCEINILEILDEANDLHLFILKKNSKIVC